jgi:hypothetical protein
MSFRSNLLVLNNRNTTESKIAMIQIKNLEDNELIKNNSFYNFN